MKFKLPILVILAIIFALTIMIQPSYAETPTTTRVIIGISTVRFELFRNVLTRYGTVISDIPEIGAVVLEINIGRLNDIKKLWFVKYVERDYEVSITQEVRWNMEMIYVPNVWYTYDDYVGDAAYGYYPYLHVAVLDTGIYYSHTDLQGAVVYCIVSLNNGATFYKGTNLRNCNDPNGHGTHVAGIIAARLNGAGVAGAAPKVRLYAVRVLSASGSGYISDIARGIIESTKGPDGVAGTADDADIISMSLGGPHSDTLYNAVKYAYSYGVVLVAAAGNDGASSPSYPAAYPEVIAVGAVDINYNVPSWSNRNPDVVAPGVDILSTYKNNLYAYMSGTSMACPHVSGVVALMQAIRQAFGLRKLTPDEVKYIIINTAIDLGSSGYDSLYGYGLVDAEYAVYVAINW
uniref:Peptidase S8 n=1 Tax=Staphylothermus marinus TaxID=2280 RepID=A0A7J3KGV2_STAMA